MLFALRTYYQDFYQDFYQDEKDIIEMLKTNLLEKNIPSDEVNTVLKNFYNEFGINIDLEIFEQINALPTEQELFNELNPLIQNFINNIINSGGSIEQSGSSPHNMQNLSESGSSSHNMQNVNECIHNQNIDDEDSDNEILDDEDSDNEILDAVDSDNEINFEINNNQPQINYYQDISSDFVSFQPYMGEQNQSNSGMYYYQSYSVLPNYGTQSNSFLGMPHNQYNLFENNNVQTNNITNLINLLTTIIPIVQHEDTDVVCTLDEEDKNKLKKYKLDEDMKIQCNICLGNMMKDEEVMDLPCDHTYHYECINEYLEKYNYKCPCCRSEVGKPKYNI